jgi:S-adenosylmethionine-diacylglycerol 3-amino-3-carboxypropyl transferase
MGDNYFWRVYLTGQYSRTCCPEYLREENFAKLQGGLVDKVHVHTDHVTGFLEKHDQPISKFVLLDHMDWLSTQKNALLQQEWQAILNNAANQSRLIWRSGGLTTDFLDPLEVEYKNATWQLNDLLTFDRNLANDLHQKDRVHTYGSFHIADLAKA